MGNREMGNQKTQDEVRVGKTYEGSEGSEGSEGGIVHVTLALKRERERERDAEVHVSL